MPGRGTLSAGNVTLILAKPRFRVVPNVVRMRFPGGATLEQLKLQ
jgi:hypothetical protein